jgi:hypothetical protein
LLFSFELSTHFRRTPEGAGRTLAVSFASLAAAVLARIAFAKMGAEEPGYRRKFDNFVEDLSRLLS